MLSDLNLVTDLQFRAYITILCTQEFAVRFHNFRSRSVVFYTFTINDDLCWQYPLLLDFFITVAFVKLLSPCLFFWVECGTLFLLHYIMYLYLSVKEIDTSLYDSF